MQGDAMSEKVKKVFVDDETLVEIIDTRKLSIDGAEVQIYWMHGLPESVFGVCGQKSDSEYLILINADKSKELQDESLEHELLHVTRNDFNSDKPVAVLEREVDHDIQVRKKQGLNPLYQELLNH